MRNFYNGEETDGDTWFSPAKEQSVDVDLRYVSRPKYLSSKYVRIVQKLLNVQEGMFWSLSTHCTAVRLYVGVKPE